MPRKAGKKQTLSWVTSFAAGVLSLGLFATPTYAQSEHGCISLDAGPEPAIEGVDGMFFRIDPDLIMDHRISKGLIADVARLSQALAAKGTKLVYVPVPTKAMVLPDRLGPDGQRYGYDANLARALYADSVAGLRAAGVITVDALAPLIAPTGNDPVFFGSDPRLTPVGQMRLARAIGRELGPFLIDYETVFLEPTGEIEMASQTRDFLQLSCQAELPPVTAQTFKIHLRPIQHDRPLPRPVIMVGSEITGEPERDGAMFLTEVVRRRNIRSTVAEDAVSALAAYLTSDDFRSDAPEAIVWQVPVWTNPTLYGDQPMGELIAAAADDCAPPVAASPSEEGGYYVELHDQGGVLRLDTGDQPVSEALFRFTSPDGEERARPVIRKGRDTATSRMYLPMTGLWPEGVTTVHVELDTELSMAPRFATCRG